MISSPWSIEPEAGRAAHEGLQAVLQIGISDFETSPVGRCSNSFQVRSFEAPKSDGSMSESPARPELMPPRSR